MLGFLFLGAGLLILLSFASFRPSDPSWNTVGESRAAQNLIGPAGAWFADFFLQAFGLGAFVLPVLIFGLGWKWMRSEALAAPGIKIFGSIMLIASACGAAALAPGWRIFEHTILPGGAAGFLIAGLLRQSFNLAGTVVILAVSLIVSVYLVSAFSLASLESWFAPLARLVEGIRGRWRRMIERRREEALQRQEEKRRRFEERAAILAEAKQREVARPESESSPAPPIACDPAATRRTAPAPTQPQDTLPWEDPPGQSLAEPVSLTSAPGVEPEQPGEIPICRLDQTPAPENVLEFPFNKPRSKVAQAKLPTLYRLPSTDLLNEVPARSAYDEQELKNTAAAIKAKFEEFNVFGSVVQINPGPVVTTFEFKPEAGIKYSRITTLTEDLCLGLQAESILIERIPGK
ncbi:MAG: DNA translocase FtsK 4TM domain-containing protein, partial [Acidobacteriota bacterium]|nr:DNA translocase FtsK 4TM domain-containing protein [Acidobacteriota bacterium]